MTPDELLAVWLGDDDRADRIVHVEDLAPRPPSFAETSQPLPDVISKALAARGIDHLYRHQAEAIDRARQDDHVAIVAGTASGKTLAYQIPIAERALDGATAIVLYPTKALAQDQLRSF